MLDNIDDLVIKKKVSMESESPKEETSWEHKVNLMKYPKLRKTVNVGLTELPSFLGINLTQIPYSCTSQSIIPMNPDHFVFREEEPNFFYVLDQERSQFFVLFQIKEAEGLKTVNVFTYKEFSQSVNFEPFLQLAGSLKDSQS